ncbi:MAG: tandem-95 repeat protein, partial [Methylococcales bacterium]|nr:tandem-95 repeat protein [Methylococcales bacterium]
NYSGYTSSGVKGYAVLFNNSGTMLTSASGTNHFSVSNWGSNDGNNVVYPMSNGNFLIVQRDISGSTVAAQTNTSIWSPSGAKLSTPSFLSSYYDHVSIDRATTSSGFVVAYGDNSAYDSAYAQANSTHHNFTGTSPLIAKKYSTSGVVTEGPVTLGNYYYHYNFVNPYGYWYSTNYDGGVWAAPSVSSISGVSGGYGFVIKNYLNSDTNYSITVKLYDTAPPDTAPTFTNATTTLTVTEDATATDIKNLLTVSDTSTGQTETWSQNVAPSHGTLSFSGATAASGTTSITPGGTITYTPTANYSGADSFTVQVNDGISTTTRAISVTVNAVNDAPVLADTMVTFSAVAEDASTPTGAVGSLVSTLIGGITDVDTSASKGIAITATDTTNGTWYYSTNNGTTWIDVSTVSTNGALLLASDANTRLYFKPNANYNGTITNGITFVAWDQTTGSAGTKVDVTSNGGTTAFSTASDTASISVTAVNDAPILSLTGANAYAAINNTPVSIFTSATTVSDIEGNYNGGTLVASISASSQTADKLAFTGSGITISSGNVAVNGTTIGTVSPTTGLTSSSTAMTVTFNANATSALIEQLVEGLQFSTTATGSARTVSVTLTDNGTVNSGSGTQTAVVSSISNTAPTFNNDVTGTAGTLDSTLPVNENATQTDISNLLAVTDADSGQTLTWSISTAPTKGTLTGFTSATGISNGGTVTPSGLYYTPTSNNVGSDSFVIQVSDGFGGTKTVTVPVTIANVLPVLGNSLLPAVAENATSFGVTVGTATATQDTNGITYSIVSGNTGNKFSIDSSTGAITTLASLDYETLSQYVLTIRATDESSATSDATFTIPVLNVAEAPVNTVPSAKTTLEDTPLVITGLSVTDVDSASLTTVLSVANGTGTLNVASGSGATVTNTNTDTVTITGTLTQINAALATVTYTPTANANGNSYATLTMRTYDGTSSAADLATAVTSTVAINVTSVVDGPLVISGATTTAEDTQSGVITIAKAAVDGAEVTHFKVTDIANGTLYKNDGTQITDNSFITAAEAASVKFIPNADYNGASSTIFNVQGSLNSSTVGSEAKTPVTMTVTAINDAPVISDLDGDGSNANGHTTNPFILGGAAVWIDTLDANAAQVTDIDSADFDGGNLTIAYNTSVAGSLKNGSFSLDTSGGVTSGDSTSSDGVIAADEILYYDDGNGAVAFGTVGSSSNDGQTGHPLVITFDAKATPNLTGGISNVTALLEYLTYTATTETGDRVFDVTITDGDGGTSDISTVTMTGTNTAPVLTSGNTYILTSTNEDTNSSGTLVSAIVDTDVGYSDADNDGTFTPTKGMAVTATTGNGAWQYSTDGTNWTGFGSVSDSAALLLSATTQVRYAPDTHNGETPNFTFRAWDTTDGSNEFAKVDTTTNGNTTAFSANTATASIVVSSVNDAPSGADKTITVNEDTAYTFAASDFGFSDTIDSPANTLNRVKITTLPNTGTLKLSGVAVTAGDFVSVANIANLTFTPAANANGTGYANFTFQVEDNGGTNNGGVNLDASANNTITVDVTAIADTPSITDASAATNAQNATGLVVSRNTADGNEVTYFKITDITGGALFQNNGSTSIVNGDFITFAQANAGLKFTPSSSTAGTFKLQASTSSVAGGLGGDVVTATITVGAGVASPTINEDTNSGAIAITGSTQYYKVTSITGGTLYSDANFLTPITDGTFVDAGSGNTATSVYFKPNPNYNSSAVSYSAGFSVQSATTNNVDNSGLTGSPSASTITITPVNDAPTVANALVDQSVNEGSALSYIFASNSFSDIDAGDTISYTATKADGSALPSWLSFDAANRTFSGTPANEDVGTLSVKVTATDSGLATVSDTFDIVIINVNDAPTATNLNAAETYTEDTALNLTDIVVSDVDSANVTATLTLSDTGAGSFNTATSGAVTSTFNAGVWSASGAKADVNSLLAGVSFTPTLNFNSNFTVNTSVSDGTAAAITGSKSFTGTAVNDAPSFTKGVNATINEDAGAQTVSNWATSLAKGGSDESGQTLSFEITNDNNTLFSSQPAIDSNGQLTYTPANDANGTTTVTVKIKDTGGTTNGGVDTSAAQTFTITVNAVNDVPVFTKGADQSVAEDAGTQTVTGFATSISKGATNESAQTLTFNVTNNNNSAFAVAPSINAAGDLTYKFADNFNGAVTVSATLSDNGGTSNSGVDTSAAQTFTLTATSVNDLPVISATTTTSTFTESGTGGTAVNLLGGTITVSDVDNTDFNGGILSVSLNNYVTGDVLSIANGNNIALSNSIVSYNSNAIATISGGAGNDLTITFNSVNATPTAVQALLGQITFANTSDDPTNKDTNPTRVATLVLNDSLGNSTPLSASITVMGENDNPTVTLTGGNAIYSAQSPATEIDTVLTLADVDNTTLNQATITLSTPPNGNDETLGLTTSATTLAGEKGLTITPYNASTHQLVISGNAAISDYETVLHGVTYVNAKTTPDMNDRTVSFSIRDSANGNTTTAPSRTIFYDRPPTQQHDVGITVNQGATGTITTSLLQYTDSVTSPVIYTIATLPTHGSLFKNSVLLLANDTFTQSD